MRLNFALVLNACEVLSTGGGDSEAEDSRSACGVSGQIAHCGDPMRGLPYHLGQTVEPIAGIKAVPAEVRRLQVGFGLEVLLDLVGEVVGARCGFFQPFPDLYRCDSCAAILSLLHTAIEFASDGQNQPACFISLEVSFDGN